MCGIAGVSGGEFPDAETRVRNMLENLGHRGPDACGIHSKGKVCIGNTLLKITGDMPQPLVGEKGAFVLNGEIFNFREIAAERRLRTDSDSEALFWEIEARNKLKAKNKFKIENETEIEIKKETVNNEERPALKAVFETLSLVNGDYALAYFCGDELVLARDPAGVKPLFYSFQKEADTPELVFASEKKAFQTNGTWGQGQGIGRLVPLPPGTLLSFNIKTGEIKEKSLKIQPPQSRIADENEAVTALNEALEKAVALRVTPGCGVAFSGGIDSVLVAAFAVRYVRDVRLYAVGLPDSHDIKQAEFAAKALGMEEIFVSHYLSNAEIEAAVPKVIRAVESTDPMKVSIGLPLYIVAKCAREDGVRVLLTGQGSDELLAGYRRHETFLEEGGEVLDREIYSDLGKISEVNLERDDMVTMANSVELRVPFLDREVIKAGLAIIPELKVKKTEGGYSRKHILRKVAEGLLPPELAWKEKKAMQYGTGVQKVLDKLAREAGFSKKEGQHIEKYLISIAKKKGVLL